ncbi:MAG: hypothetical protein JF615_07195 [Asticcacaulis sp.]|nr:hypothetical protein [Asticcacaulis sp.]
MQTEHARPQPLRGPWTGGHSSGNPAGMPACAKQHLNVATGFASETGQRVDNQDFAACAWMRNTPWWPSPTASALP